MRDRPNPADTLFLVDGTNSLYRAFHAIRELSNSKGLPTNAIYGFTGMLRKLIKDFQPSYMAVLFDRPEPTFRHQAFPDYKAHRPETPESLITQIPYIKQVCEVLRVPVLELPGYEADDLIGTLADRARQAGHQVVIVSTDKDLLQLVGGGVKVFHPTKERLLDSADVEELFGVRPDQVVDVLALWGDSSDNIPGVPGIGDKGAKELIKRYGDLDTLLRQAESVPNRRYREPLLSHADAARMSRDLATVRLDVPVTFDLERLRLHPPDAAAAHQLFSELEFGAFLRDLPASGQSSSAAHEIILSLADLDRAIERLRAAGRFALNLERDRAEPMWARLIGVALAAGEGDAFYVPLAHRGLQAPAQLGVREVLERLAPVLLDPGLHRVGHNVKNDLIVLGRHHGAAGRFAFDTMLAGYLLDPSRRSHTLDVTAQDVAGLSPPAYAALLGQGARATPIEEADPAATGALVCGRVAAVSALEAPLRSGLSADGLGALLDDLEMPLMEVLAAIEQTGVRIDVPFLERLSAEWEQELQKLTAAIHQLAGGSFNINSPRQLGEILFETLKLKPGRRTRKTGSYSTDVEVLEELAADHELPRRLLEYRSLQKLKSTYVDTLPALVHPETGRVHTSFNQAVAATGRLSSSDPNLQNIPIRSEQGRSIRRAFIPEEGFLLLSADYSQIELRVLAHLCGDPGLVSAFQHGEDVHQRTAAELFGVLPGLVTGAMRRRAKAVNFGIVYGMGPQRLARDQGVTFKEAEAFIREYFARFPGVKQYIDATIATAESEGRVRTILGRLRYFPEIRGSDRNLRQQAIRAAVNTTIQGSAADLIKKAMVDLRSRLLSSGLGGRMILQVHDELVLEVPEGEAGATGALVREVMESAFPLRVPLVVDVLTGPNWLDLRSESGRSKD